ncbi:MAG: SPOR domain-containing protein [Xanthomonadales bacterium]|jgi:cell division septation protein DedD|nr:SPOR domain-containing protein [Xanthomonadales bacterium]
MDKALKQRLVGASVLVALAVIILPMLLGGQPESTQDTRPIEIPPRPPEVSFETRRFPIGEQSPDEPSTLPETGTGEKAVDGSAGTEFPAGQQAPLTLEQRLEQVAAENAARQQGEGDAQAASPAAGAVDRPSPATVEIAADPREDVGPGSERGPDEGAGGDTAPVGSSSPATADPVAESTPQPQNVPGAPAGGRYLVQVASFSSTANANRLAGSLRESGLPVLMDTVESSAGTLHRVRVGSFEQRAEAEQVLARLGRQVPDVRPRLVDLRPEEGAPITQPNDPLVRWVVQVGVFSGQNNAEQLVFRLRDAGFRASSQSRTGDGGTVYRVLVGPEVSRDDALRIRDRIEAEQGIKGIVQSTD